MVYHLFPYFDGGQEILVNEQKLKHQLSNLISPFENSLAMDSKKVVTEFLDFLPEIRVQLQSDAEFIEANDPATSCVEEVVMTYPGFFAIMVYRLANRLKLLEIPMIPRIMTEHAHSITGIDINPGATIGSDFFIDHGTGIVIGESTTIGNRVKIYQGVTLGALSVCKEAAQTKRHPTIENDVVIYAGATILGGKTTIGHNSVIGGNVWLTSSIPPYSIVQHNDKVMIKQREPIFNYNL